MSVINELVVCGAGANKTAYYTAISAKIAGLISQYMEDETTTEQWTLTILDEATNSRQPRPQPHSFYDIHSMTRVKMRLPATVVCGPRIVSDLMLDAGAGLPTRWRLNLHIGDTTCLIPSPVADSFLALWKRERTSNQMQCNDFVSLVTQARNGPMITDSATDTCMHPWDPIVLSSDSLSAAQRDASLTLTLGFLHAALWTGVRDYYLSKIGTAPVYALCTHAELCHIFPTYSKTTYSRPFRAFCGNTASACVFSQQPPPRLLYCACRQIQFCSKQCQRAMWPSHKPVCQFTRQLFASSLPYWILTADEIRRHATAAASFDPLAHAKIAGISKSNFHKL